MQNAESNHHSSLANIADSLQDQTNSISNFLSGHSNNFSSHETNSTQHIQNVKQTADFLCETFSQFSESIGSKTQDLVEKELQKEVPSQKTPMKKSYEYPKQWRRTRPYESIIFDAVLVDKLEKTENFLDSLEGSKENIELGKSEPATPSKLKKKTFSTLKRNALPLGLQKSSSNDAS